MKFETQKDKIIIYSKDEFNPKHILECGQIFSYFKTNEGYVVLSKDKKATITETQDIVTIHTEDVEYFVNFFDLNTDYSQIKSNLITSYPYMQKAINYGYGIRILKQDFFETIISFIISANNNIKRIQKILFAIREKYGLKMGDYFAFPSVEQLSSASEQDFKLLGAGYRAKYLYEACRQLKNIDLNSYANLSTPELLENLLKISGVGPKVADCILLFGYSKMDVFPVDTWIEKVYCTYFKEEHNRTTIRKELLNTFKNYAGYAQQYLFYSQREQN